MINLVLFSSPDVTFGRKYIEYHQNIRYIETFSFTLNFAPKVLLIKFVMIYLKVGNFNFLTYSVNKFNLTSIARSHCHVS